MFLYVGLPSNPAYNLLTIFVPHALKRRVLILAFDVLGMKSKKLRQAGN